MINMLQNIDPFVYKMIWIVSPALLLSLFGFFFKKNVATWSTEERGFVGLERHWDKIFYSSWAGGWGAGIIAGVLTGGNIYAVMIFAILTYVLIFSSYTDIIVHKAPKEVARVGILSILPFAALSIWGPASGSVNLFNTEAFLVLTRITVNIPTMQLIAFGIWMAIPIIMFIVSRGGLGMADIRLFVLFGVSLSWWIGIIGMFIIFFIANLIQVLAFIPAQKYNWGQMITLKNGKTKRAVPFIPALAVSFIIGSFYFLTVM